MINKAVLTLTKKCSTVPQVSLSLNVTTYRSNNCFADSVLLQFNTSQGEIINKDSDFHYLLQLTAILRAK